MLNANSTLSTLSTRSETLSKLSPEQAQVAAALAQGYTVTAAARAVGMHRTTIYRWLKNVPSFAEAAVEARKEYVHTLRDEVKEMSSQALSTLRNLLNDPATPPHVRLKTALAILERPHFPDPDWHFPESLNSQRQEEVLQAVADLQAGVRALDARADITERVHRRD